MDKIKEIEYKAQYMVDVLKNFTLDYSVESIKHLDTVIDIETIKGKPKNPDSFFGKNFNLLMFSMASYMAHVIIKHTKACEIQVEPDDENWIVNFKIVSKNGWQTQPGQRLVKRLNNGREDELYAYVASGLKYLDQEEDPNELSNGSTFIQEIHVREDDSPKKKWWKKLF